MSVLRQARFWTALLVIGLAGLTVPRSLTLTRFALIDGAADDASAAPRLQPFVNETSVGYLARARLFELVETDAGRQVEDLRDLLTAQPLGSRAWLALAAAQLASGAPKDKVFGALAMSNLTGPNEGQTMSERANFGVPLWSIAPPQMQKMLISDLIGGWGEVTQEHRAEARAALKQAQGQTREAISAALARAGKDGVSIAKALDLGAPEPPESAP